MKIDFANLNLAPMPNPKPLAVERVTVKADHTKSDPQGAAAEYGFIRNAAIDHIALIERW